MDVIADPVAVVGLGCVVPDAFDVSSFWRRARAGQTSVRELAGETWQWARYLDKNDGAVDADRTYSTLGAQVLGWRLDWKRFRIPPSDLDVVNPLQFMVLDAGAQALGGLKRLPNATTGLFLGSTGLGWQRDTGLRLHLSEAVEAIAVSPAFRALPAADRKRVIEQLSRELDQRLRPVSDDNVVGAAASVAAGRIAMQFDLKGLHYAVDAGFASALASVDVGVRALRDGTLDCAVVGGVSELLTPLELVAFSRLGGLARTKVAPFCAQAEGTLLGEGVVLFALKRLEDALADGETIHAVIRGVGGSSDGRGKSVVAPRSEGQSLAMANAWNDSGVDPARASYVECHATGTQVGDVSEVQALGRVIPPRVSDAPRVWLGSAKAQVGHLRGGAGAVALLRATLAVRDRLVPRQTGITQVNPALELERTPFGIPQREEPLADDVDVFAGVSAFGFGGNNFHAVIASPPLPGAARRPARAPVRAAREPIAIVGMGGLFPTGNDVESFWRSLLNEDDATTTIPAERWSVERHYDPDPQRLDTTYSKVGCFLPELPVPTSTMGIPPSAFANLDPSQTLVMMAAEQALSSSGIDLATVRAKTSVYLAFLPYQGQKFSADMRVNWREYEHELRRALDDAGVDDATQGRVCAEAAARFKSGLPAITEDSLTGYLGSLCAGRLTRAYDLHGPHFVVDSACASTHAAVHAAVTALHHKTADLVLSGGVWCDMRPEFFVAACRFNALSPTGIRPFDAGADGFIPGEGVGVFALRRLSDAQERGEKIIALIRSVAGSSDGRGRSLLAPRPEGEALAMTRALQEAQIDPHTVGYVECHGTGTALGDVTEVDAMTRAYAPNDVARPRPLLIGSVKGNIGHLNAAAGVPALMKAALMVQSGTLPRSVKCETKNPAVDWQKGPVDVVTARQTLERAPGSPRRVGVSGFGVGGSNMHLLIEEHVPGAPQKGTRAADDSDDDALPIALAGGPDLSACVVGLRAIVAAARRDGLATALARVAAAPIGGPVRVAIVAHDVDALEKKIALIDGTAPAAALRAAGVVVGNVDKAAKLVFCFPGQGTQYAGMAAELARRFSVVRETFDEVDRAYTAIAGRNLTTTFQGPTAHSIPLRDEDAHCAVFAVAVAVARLLQRFGVVADAVLGQSAGELAALVVAGALSLKDGLQLVYSRTAAVLALHAGPGQDAGKMVSLRCGVDEARAFVATVPGFLVISADNCRTACLVSGSSSACAALVAAAAADDVEASVLPVSHAYHSEMIAAAQPAYRAALQAAAFTAPAVPHYSTVTGAAVVDSSPAGLRALLARQFVEPVLFRDAVHSSWRDGARLFVECGPKWPLSTFIDDILADAPHCALPTLHPKTGEVEQLVRAIAGLCAHGRASLPVPAPPPKPEATTMTTTTTTTTTPAAALSALAALGSSAAPADPALRQLLLSVRDAIDVYLGATASSAQARAAAAPVIAPVIAAPVPTTTTTAPAAVAPPRSRAVGPDRLEVTRQLIDAAVAGTGYPAEMLELDLDLEADLGIDTVKQVAIIAKVKRHFGLPRDATFKLRDHNTLHKVVDHILQKLAEAPPVEAAPPSVAPTTIVPTSVLATRTPQAFAPPPQLTPSAARPITVTPSSSPPSSQADEVRRVLIECAVARTGYPAEMLELDLDLEADLGIDTVKQVAIIAETKRRFGLPRDAQFKLRDHNTLRKVIEHIATRAASTSPPAPTMPPTTTTPTTTPPTTMETTMPPVPALPMSAPVKPAADDDGPSSALRVQGGSAARVQRAPTPVAVAPTYRTVVQVPGGAVVDETDLLALLVEGARRGGRIGRLASFVDASIARASSGGALTVDATDGAVLGLRVVEGGAQLASGAVLIERGPPEGDAPAASRELVAIAARSAQRHSSAQTLAQTLELLSQASSWPRHLELLDAVAGSFNEIVARVQLRADVQRGTDAPAVAALLAAAGALLGVNGAALSGTAYSLAHVDAARFWRVPGAGEDLSVCARMFTPRAGQVCGDATIVDVHGKVVVEIQGIALRPRSGSGAAPFGGLSREAWGRLRAFVSTGVSKSEGRT